MVEEAQETQVAPTGIYIAKMRPSLKGTLMLGKDDQGKTIRKKFQFVSGAMKLEDPKEIAEMDRQLTGILGQHVLKVNPDHASAMAKDYNERRLAQSSAVSGTFTSEDSANARHEARMVELAGSEKPKTDPDLAAEMAAKIQADVGMQATIPQDLSAQTAADDAAIAAAQADKASVEGENSEAKEVKSAFAALKKD